MLALTARPSVTSPGLFLQVNVPIHDQWPNDSMESEVHPAFLYIIISRNRARDLWVLESVGQPLILPHLQSFQLTLKVLVMTTDAQWEGMGDVGPARYEQALLPPCPTNRALSYSN